MKGVDALVERGIADPDRLAVSGWSYGGFMSSTIVTKTDRFKAAVVGAAVTNLASFTGTTDIPEFSKSYFKSWAWEDSAAYVEHSALFHAGNVKTPSLRRPRRPRRARADQPELRVLRCAQGTRRTDRPPDPAAPAPRPPRAEAAADGPGLDLPLDREVHARTLTRGGTCDGAQRRNVRAVCYVPPDSEEDERARARGRGHPERHRPRRAQRARQVLGAHAPRRDGRAGSSTPGRCWRPRASPGASSRPGRDSSRPGSGAARPRRARPRPAPLPPRAAPAAAPDEAGVPAPVARLLRVMISAARADGELGPAERERILARGARGRRRGARAAGARRAASARRARGGRQRPRAQAAALHARVRDRARRRDGHGRRADLPGAAREPPRPRSRDASRGSRARRPRASTPRRQDAAAA